MPSRKAPRRKSRPPQKRVKIAPASANLPAKGATEGGDGAAAKPDNKFPIVGIGASAGGLEAMTRLLRALPNDNQMALVLVQHLDPKHESMLVDILSRETRIAVREVRDGMKAEPRHLYVIPPNASMELVDGSFHIGKRRATSRVPLPIDEFFTSLAEIQKSASIGVILSGNASDGMLGMRAIKAEGGITFAQDESAQFQGMPRAAISAGAVDFVMAPEEIARELERVAHHPFLYVEKGREQRPDGETLRKIFGMIRSATGVDFSFYRQTTILRRLARRMAINKVVSYSEYLAMLRKTPAEVNALFDDFLISVTAFFRDPETFDLLQQRVIPDLLKDRPNDQPMRVWVPGCATGEEAYSIAISVVEAQEPSRPVDVQIFATDVSDQAVDHARQGVYDESSLHNVSAERLRRFFNKVDGRYQVAKSIRDICIFARQNVATDPPFSHLDILSCRNLLIYLEPTLQRRLLPLFHHVLKPNGFLVLGPAESAASFGDLFTPIDKRQRIFTKRVSGSRPAPLAIMPRQFGEPTRIGGVTPRAREEVAGLDLPREIDRVLLGRYAPPSVVINSNLEIVQFRGKTGAVLEPPSGAANLNVLAMAREGLLPDLRAAIHKAKTRDVRARKDGIRVRSNGGFRTVDLEIVPLKSGGASGRLYLLVFEVHPELKPAPRAEERARVRQDGLKMSAARREIERLTKELVSTKEYLQAVIEEQESTNEELKSANEEILSSNEELQSTNEELDTAKEELQSANEELTTLNEELQNRNAQLSRANDDLVNLLHSVQIPIVMLGSEGRIRRFTPAAEKLLNLIPSDVGRPLQNIRPNLSVPDLASLVLETVDTITAKQLEIRDNEGCWHLMRIQPYRTLDNKIDGAVLSFIDIDAQKTSAIDAEKARDYAEAIVETVPEALLVLDAEFSVQRANTAYYRLFRTTAEQTTGWSLFELGGGHWDVPGLRKRLQENHTQEIEVEKEFDRIGRRTMLLRARWARFGADGGGHVLLSIEDVTDRRVAERQLQSSEAQYRGVFESPSEGAIVLDAETGQIADANRYLTEFLGITREKLVGKKPWELAFFGGAENLRRWIAGIEGAAPLGDLTLSNPDGRVILMEPVQRVFLPGARKQLTLMDVTQRRRLEQELRHVQKMESIGRLAGGMAHDFNNILNIISAYAESLKRGGEPAKVSDAAAAISKSVARGAGVVRQLLTFARKDEAAFRAVAINDVVREAAQIVGETFPKNLKVSTDLADKLPDVMADPDQVHQALLNLFVNARDAMPQGGELRLSTRKLDQKAVRERHPEATAVSYVRIEVTDTGEGMDDETRARVFEPFFTTKERGAGSGMGLAVVYGVVASHRGFVDVESAPGKGTTFRLDFPVLAARLERGAKRPRRSGPAPGGSETILFVEDEKELLESVAELLKQEGYKVLTAHTGEDALQIYREKGGEISLVVTDVELPEMSGWDAFRKIHDANPDVRAVMVSGYLDPPMRARMLEGGAKGFLRKPYTLDEMLRTMREVLDEAPPGREKAGK
jgi:two-component system, chemotaxis family, CheB/CheR fusion protein